MNIFCVHAKDPLEESEGALWFAHTWDYFIIM